MNKLSFDLQAAKEQLTHVYRDRIAAQSAVMAVLNTDIAQVELLSHQGAIPNLTQLVARMKSDLQMAQNDGRQWFNEVQPMLTVIPQGAINYASVWNAAIPLVITELEKSEPDRRTLTELFQGLGGAVGDQVSPLNALLRSLQSIQTAVTTDASNFSSAHSQFQQLEDIDKQEIAHARAVLAKLSLLVEQLNQQIGVDTINADRDLSLATTAMEYGKKRGRPGQVVGVTIAIVTIITASFSINDLIAAVNAKIAAAQKQSEYQLDLSELTAQLLALEAASNALASFADELGDMIASLQKTIVDWQEEAAQLAAIVSDLATTKPVHTIVSLFDLGRAQAQWEDLASFSTKWQSLDVAAKAADVLVVEGSLPNTAMAAATAAPRTASNVRDFTPGRASC